MTIFAGLAGATEYGAKAAWLNYRDELLSQSQRERDAWLHNLDKELIAERSRMRQEEEKAMMPHRLTQAEEMAKMQNRLGLEQMQAEHEEGFRRKPGEAQADRFALEAQRHANAVALAERRSQLGLEEYQKETPFWLERERQRLGMLREDYEARTPLVSARTEEAARIETKYHQQRQENQHQLNKLMQDYSVLTDISRQQVGLDESPEQARAASFQNEKDLLTYRDELQRQRDIFVNVDIPKMQNQAGFNEKVAEARKRDFEEKIAIAEYMRATKATSERQQKSRDTADKFLIDAAKMQMRTQSGGSFQMQQPFQYKGKTYHPEQDTYYPAWIARSKDLLKTLVSPQILKDLDDIGYWKEGHAQYILAQAQQAEDAAARLAPPKYPEGSSFGRGESLLPRAPGGSAQQPVAEQRQPRPAEKTDVSRVLALDNSIPDTGPHREWVARALRAGHSDAHIIRMLGRGYRESQR